ncbi:uncharacterized protein [Oryza sativa Japonica Group]|uniref:Expressed protein n=3 Tax=Oryza sativa subsp. japonica TaxID=39947 RepID=Q2R8Q5_ORYSJ|nr:uncharacterized protein LOC4350097 [Oryza sativa Japonica Group]ABA92100.2 expressed protein [Oryza sativa Japonica Group]BAF27886.1 Os11g0220700 [Oryza sativa Japonica Group]BAG91294.1 unnamed protein product [Oryza sativa Japonica Group]|eukprot:NP_001067523.1 Os11g0220700 [Oryza sativa Japonica Group]
MGDAGGPLPGERRLSPADPEEPSPPASSSDGTGSGGGGGENSVEEGDGEGPGSGSGTPTAKRQLFDADGSASRPTRRRRIASDDEITQAFTGETTSENTSSTNESNPFIAVLDSMWSKKRELDAIKEAGKDERHEKLLSLQKERLALERQKLEYERNLLEFKRNQRDERIMNMDLSDMTGQLREYYLRLQGEIMARRSG